MASGFRADRTVASERQRTRRLFNRFAGVLAVLDPHLKREYARALAGIDLDGCRDALDLGTGSANLACALAARGLTVTGVDFSERSLARARRACPGLRLVLGDLAELDGFRARSVDLVAVAYVLHGLPAPLREEVLRQAGRIARRLVLVLDYAGRGPWYVRLIEYFEGPHYPAFVERPLGERLAAAGLSLLLEARTSRIGGAWLARPPSG